MPFHNQHNTPIHYSFSLKRVMNFFSYEHHRGDEKKTKFNLIINQTIDLLPSNDHSIKKYRFIYKLNLLLYYKTTGFIPP